ncbi:MAG: ribosome maturation factor RimP [Oscillospiraceae bacterium]|jgi:ribosome maturation factor RimP|nr:ribosome maturation factor RimP [Oscillospiraceae bacterium]
MKYKKLNPTEKRVYEQAKKLTDEMGYILWDIEFLKEGAEWYLRVLIDSEEGITIEDCEKVTKPLDDWLDKEDFIKESYIFEVGSAGLGRELKTAEHLEWALNEQVEIKLIRPVDAEKIIIGELTAYTADTINNIPLDNISKIRIYENF